MMMMMTAVIIIIIIIIVTIIIMATMWPKTTDILPQVQRMLLLIKTVLLVAY
jgi:hypothetical protein